MPDWMLWALGLLLGGGALGWILKTLIIATLSKTYATTGDLDGYGSRVNGAESGISALVARMDKVEYNVQGLQYEHKETTREMVELRDMIRDTAKNLDKYQKDMDTEVRTMSNTVVRMETTVGHMAEMNRELLKTLTKGGNP